MQQIMIAGNLGSNPELRYLQNGQAVCNFSVASNRRWKNANGEQQEEVTWHRIAVWGTQGEACNQYLKKGSKVLVVGRVRANAYIDKNGQPAASLEVTASHVEFMDRKPEGDFAEEVAEELGATVTEEDILF